MSERAKREAETSRPTVSVIMTAYNEEAFIKEAIKSILAQTFSDWELIVVDDGSTDRTAEIALAYAAADPRVRVICRPHEGRAHALNVGLEMARGRYIAIFDADDLALPTRLETQVRYLDEHIGIGVVGSFCIYRDVETGAKWLGKVPLEDRKIRRTVFWRMPFNHTTLMIRREAINNLKYEEGEFFKDYVFCASLLARCKAANIPKPLVIVNRHAGSVTQQLERVNYVRAFRSQFIVLKILKGRPYHYFVLIRPLLGLIKHRLLFGILRGKG